MPRDRIADVLGMLQMRVVQARLSQAVSRVVCGCNTISPDVGFGEGRRAPQAAQKKVNVRMSGHAFTDAILRRSIVLEQDNESTLQGAPPNDKCEDGPEQLQYRDLLISVSQGTQQRKGDLNREILSLSAPRCLQDCRTGPRVAYALRLCGITEEGPGACPARRTVPLSWSPLLKDLQEPAQASF